MNIYVITIAIIGKIPQKRFILPWVIKLYMSPRQIRIAINGCHNAGSSG